MCSALRTVKQQPFETKSPGIEGTKILDRRTSTSTANISANISHCGAYRILFTGETMSAHTSDDISTLPDLGLRVVSFALQFDQQNQQRRFDLFQLGTKISMVTLTSHDGLMTSIARDSHLPSSMEEPALPHSNLQNHQHV